MAQAAARFGETFGIASQRPGPGGGSRAKSRPPPGPLCRLVHAFLVSTGVVALAEIGDKTQLLTLMLAARFQRPWPIVAGILVFGALGGVFLWIAIDGWRPLAPRWHDVVLAALGVCALAVLSLALGPVLVIARAFRWRRTVLAWTSSRAAICAVVQSGCRRRSRAIAAAVCVAFCAAPGVPGVGGRGR
jgi:hypothetical protein